MGSAGHRSAWRGPARLRAFPNPQSHRTCPGSKRGSALQARAVRRRWRRVQPATPRGPGGWSWYTGSAAWLYSAGLKSILGLRRSGDCLTLDPCIPPEWKGFEITYQYRSATYRIAVENPQGRERGVVTICLDGRPSEDATISLIDDGQSHDVRVFMGNS
ncbi:MAG: glycosyl hydrolase family 65 protein [Isosphaeraceae bacterium]